MQFLLFVFSVLGLLGVLLLTTTSVTNTNNYFYAPLTQQPVYAQDDKDEEDDEEDSSKDKDDEDEDSSKDEEDEEQQQESESELESSNETLENGSETTTTTTTTTIAEPLEQISDEWLDITQEKEQLQEQAQQVLTEEEQVKEKLDNILIQNNWTNPNIPDPKSFNKNLTDYYHQTLQQLDPSCNCTDPSINPPSFEPPIVNQTFTPNPSIVPQGLQQIILDPMKDIKNYQSFGKITQPLYANFYNATKVLDNTIDEYSFWSQYDKSGFIIELFPQALQNWEVCSAEIISHDPKGVPSTLQVGPSSSKTYNGILDTVNEKIEFDSCVQKADKITMGFDAPGKFTSIAELKLFGKLLSPQPQEPIPTEPMPTTGNTTKIEIKDSNALIDIINSTVAFKFDANSAQATNYNVITIPNEQQQMGAKN